MKKLSFITGMLIGLMVLLAALGAVCGAVDQMATDENFYGAMSRAAAAKYLNAEHEEQAGTKVTEYIGLTAEQQDEFAAHMASFMAGETDVQPDILNEKEKQHMLDVRGITQRTAEAGKTCLTLAAVLAVIAAWTGAKLKRRVAAKAIGALAGLGAVAAAAAYIASLTSGGGFSVAFVGMHEMMFTNDLWLMDPAQDILIRMMPQPLFEQALDGCAAGALRLMAVSLLMLAAVHVIVENMIRRRLEKK